MIVLKSPKVGMVFSLSAIAILAGLFLSAPAKARDNRIRFAYQDRVGSVIPIVSVRKGFFEEQGVKLRSLRFSSGPACAEALYSGAADIGTMGDTTAVIMTVRNPRFVIIASHATGEHRHRIMVRQDSPFRTFNDLKGKRIGVKRGTSTYGGLLAAFKRNQLSRRKVKMIDLSPPVMIDALLAGSLDAFAASEPTPSAAELKGARELATLGGLGNQYPVLIVVNRDFLEKRKGDVIKFLQAMKKASGYVSVNYEDAVSIMVSETGLSETTCRKAMKNHSYRLKLDGEIRSSLELTALFLKEQGIIAKVPDFSKSMALGLLDYVMKH